MTYEQIEKKMKQWRKHIGILPMPQEYIDYHRALAEEALGKLSVTVHSKGLQDDGWFDGMQILQAVIELPDGELVKVKWHDNRSKGYFMQKCKGGGWGVFKGEEARIFRRFKTPDSLAIALGNSDTNIAERALRDIRNLVNVRVFLTRQLRNSETLTAKTGSIEFVGRYEFYTTDIETFRTLADYDAGIPVKPIPVPAPELEQFKTLSDEAVTNIRDYYSEDFDLVQTLVDLGHLPASYITELNDPYVPTP